MDKIITSLNEIKRNIDHRAMILSGLNAISDYRSYCFLDSNFWRLHFVVNADADAKIELELSSDTGVDMDEARKFMEALNQIRMDHANKVLEERADLQNELDELKKAARETRGQIAKLDEVLATLNYRPSKK